MLCLCKFSFEPDRTKGSNYDQRPEYDNGAWARIANGILQLVCEEVRYENTRRQPEQRADGVIAHGNLECAGNHIDDGKRSNGQETQSSDCDNSGLIDFFL